MSRVIFNRKLGRGLTRRIFDADKVEADLWARCNGRLRIFRLHAVLHRFTRADEFNWLMAPCEVLTSPCLSALHEWRKR